ncbi:glycosyltransferase family 2 protein [Aeromicrobium wangtongii]|uniref:glycosyltransferase family 2 protein n=1 Tax=Aeromicrobium wangtongii TaxID=2969247 RepID=UPI0020170050|nr:glycosyltransferase [Aeromicrobium wangtongii]MCL3817237.1 glycosyltransferase [Aeromicrobium wangtongii]
MHESDVDLIVGSIGRLDRLERLAKSLCAPTGVNVRLIVVEQVDPVGAREVLVNHAGHLVWDVLECERGLSRARNVGLAAATAPIVGFPDDDCWYEADTLKAVVEAFRQTGSDFVIGRQVTSAGYDVLRTPKSESFVDQHNVWRIAMSSAIFAQRPAVYTAGCFDENLGVGASTPFQSGEETDLVLNMIATKHVGSYVPTIVIRHPRPDEVANRLSRATGRGYGRGMGRVLAKHGFRRLDVFRHVARPLLGSLVALFRADARLAQFRLSVAQGRLEGYLSTRQEVRILAHEQLE